MWIVYPDTTWVSGGQFTVDYVGRRPPGRQARRRTMSPTTPKPAWFCVTIEPAGGTRRERPDGAPQRARVDARLPRTSPTDSSVHHRLTLRRRLTILETTSQSAEARVSDIDLIIERLEMRGHRITGSRRRVIDAVLAQPDALHRRRRPAQHAQGRPRDRLPHDEAARSTSTSSAACCSTTARCTTA